MIHTFLHDFNKNKLIVFHESFGVKQQISL